MKKPNFSNQHLQYDKRLYIGILCLKEEPCAGDSADCRSSWAFCAVGCIWPRITAEFRFNRGTAGGEVEKRAFLLLASGRFNRNELAGKMEELCKNCQYFEAKGLIIDKDTWGLCHKSGVKLGAFRWGEDAGCVDFKPKEKSKQTIKKIVSERQF